MHDSDAASFDWAGGIGLGRLTAILFVFSKFAAIENVHPLQGGFLRRKYRCDRRPSLPVEPAWSFWPKFVWETVVKHIDYVHLWEQSLNGLLLPRYLLFHLSMAAVWLFLTVKVLEARRWA